MPDAVDRSDAASGSTPNGTSARRGTGDAGERGPGDVPTDPSRRVGALQDYVNDRLRDAVADRGPAELYDPIRYVVDGGGKRARPVVLLLVADALGTSFRRALPAALSVEVFHNFTLVHDDIMDDSDLRRGRPTIHARGDRDWRTSTAILAGDMMMGLAYQFLADLDADLDRWAVQDVFHPMVEALCRGQALDEALEDRTDATVEEYLHMIDGKTVALFASCFEIGAILGGADASLRQDLRRAGEALGRGFQIQDDLIDLIGDTDETGKPEGGDLTNGKRTYVTLTAVEKAGSSRPDWMNAMLDGGLSPDNVARARDWMREAGVFDETEAAFTRYFREARSALDGLPSHPSTEALIYLIDYLQDRNH